MTSHTNAYQLNSDLILQDTPQNPITVYVLTLTITTQNETLIDSRLTFQVNYELYQRIRTQGLFNLQPELCGSFTNGEFDQVSDIVIIASLKPDLLASLTPYLHSLPDYLQTLNQAESNHPLFSVNNWLALQVNQQSPTNTTSYRTFWDYLNTARNDIEDIDGNSLELNHAITNFFQDWAENNLEFMTNQVFNQTLSEITQSLEEWLDIGTSAFEAEKLSQAIREMANAFEKLADVGEDKNNSSQNIFEVIIDFFTADEWPYTKIPGESILQTAFSGKNGTWNCYALARVEQEQFVFYSVYPTLAPEDKRLALAEFTTRANSGMIIGNFELDFERGEIRYKTSIDVTEDRLSFTSIKNLVYTNVTMMDKYLPGILSIIEDNVAPQVAIEQIESIPDEPESLDDQEEIFAVNNSDLQAGLSINLSSLTSLVEPSNKSAAQSYILTKLTPEEIAQFHQALQLMPPYQRKQSEAIIEKLKKAMLSKLGDIGEEIYSQAYTFFTQVPLSVKHLKLIQRYSGIAQRNRGLWQSFQNWIQQHGKPPVNSRAGNALLELEKQFWRIDERLCQLPTDNLEGRREVELLMEIEQFREQLYPYDNLITEIEINPSSGFLPHE
ncbi:MAG TPA: YbjN domain-containing protein [Nostocaceae cyanobacterium]|nr:YbjN domain-containing protein [Nostocaceae cyanobacterium]